MKLTGRVAVVTGAGRGIGRAIALAFCAEGAAVLCADRDPTTVEDTAGALRAAGARAIASHTDVGNEGEVDAMVARALAELGGLDVMVCNAGVGFHRAFVDLALADWERVLRVNLTGAFLCAQRAARVMLERGRGNIIVIGSTSGQRGAMARTAYGVSKAGVMQMTRIAAVELAHAGIRVNAIAPGPVATPLSLSNHTESQKRTYRAMIPLGRYGETDEVARVAVFLASDDSGYITGQVLNVDGGMDAAGLMIDIAELRSYARRGPGQDPR